MLKQIPLPPLAEPSERPRLSAAEYDRRIRSLEAAGAADWLLVYGDREHHANLAFLCGFDPRFEEALLLIGPGGRRALLVGNEGLGYVSALGLPLEVRLCQSLSLMGQSRASAPRLGDILRAAGLGPGASVGVVGWKYLEPEETDDPSEPAFVPAWVVSTLRRVCGAKARIVDATHLLMHPTQGLKSRNGADQIAAYAWAAERASAGVLRVVRGLRPGMREDAAVGLIGYAGEPLSCHLMLSGGSGPIVGLRSPSTRPFAYGDGVTTALGYWGSLCCRAGLLRDTPDESFLKNYVNPYFQTIATWWQTLRIGVSGGAVQAAIDGALAGAAFAPALNPGHLIAGDEWTHSPIRPGSEEQIASGMVLQCDIIPTPLPDGTALNCEDTVAVADEQLRAELAAGHPALWARIVARRAWMREALGITLADELLPLSAAPAYLPPFWMASELVCSLL